MHDGAQTNILMIKTRHSMVPMHLRWSATFQWCLNSATHFVARRSAPPVPPHWEPSGTWKVLDTYTSPWLEVLGASLGRWGVTVPVLLLLQPGAPARSQLMPSALSTEFWLHELFPRLLMCIHAL